MVKHAARPIGKSVGRMLGSGTQVQDVNRLLKQFEEARKMMKRMQGLRGGKGGFPGMPKLPFM